MILRVLFGDLHASRHE